MEITTTKNQTLTTTSQEEFSLPFLNLLNESRIDWEGNCIFEDGKVVGFRRDCVSNNFHMRPIPQSEKALTDAAQALKTLESVMQPATREQIGIAIKKLTLHCGMQAKTPEEIKAMFNDYCHDLGKYPIKLINEACEKYRQLPEDNQFMPSSGKLISYMTDKYYKMQFMKKRIEKILGVYTEEKPRENKPISLMEALDKMGIV